MLFGEYISIVRYYWSHNQEFQLLDPFWFFNSKSNSEICISNECVDFCLLLKYDSRIENILESARTPCIYIYYHYSPEIRRLCLMKWSSIMLHNLSWNPCSFFHFQFVQIYLFPKLVISEECHYNAYTMYQGYVLLY